MFAASLIKKLKVDLEEAQAQAQEFDARLETVHRETAVTRKENAFLKEQLSTELERTNRAEKGFKRLEVVYDKQAHRLKQFIYFYAKLSQSYAVSLQDAKKHQHAAKQIIVCWYIKTFRRRKHQRTLLSSITRIQRQAATLVPGGPGIELDESHLDKNENNQYTQSKRGGGEEEEEEKKQKRKAYTALLMEQHKYSTEEHPMVQIHHQVDKLREVVDRYQDVGQKLQEKAFRAEQEKVNLQKALQHERRERERTEQAFKDYVASVRAIKRKNKVLTKKLQSADLGNIHNHRLYHAKRRKEYRMRSIEADKEMQQKDQELKLRSNTITTLIHQVEVLKSRVAHDTRTIKSLVNLIPHQFLANQNYHPSASPVPFSEEAKAQGAEDSNKPNLTNAYLLPEKYAMYDKVNIELRTLQAMMANKLARALAPAPTPARLLVPYSQQEKLRQMQEEKETTEGEGVGERDDASTDQSSGGVHRQDKETRKPGSRSKTHSNEKKDPNNEGDGEEEEAASRGVSIGMGMGTMFGRGARRSRKDHGQRGRAEAGREVKTGEGEGKGNGEFARDDNILNRISSIIKASSTAEAEAGTGKHKVEAASAASADMTPRGFEHTCPFCLHQSTIEPPASVSALSTPPLLSSSPSAAAAAHTRDAKRGLHNRDHHNPPYGQKTPSNRKEESGDYDCPNNEYSTDVHARNDTNGSSSDGRQRHPFHHKGERQRSGRGRLQTASTLRGKGNDGHRNNRKGGSSSEYSHMKNSSSRNVHDPRGTLHRHSQSVGNQNRQNNNDNNHVNSTRIGTHKRGHEQALNSRSVPRPSTAHSSSSSSSSLSSSSSSSSSLSSTPVHAPTRSPAPPSSVRRMPHSPAAMSRATRAVSHSSQRPRQSQKQRLGAEEKQRTGGWVHGHHHHLHDHKHQLNHKSAHVHSRELARVDDSGDRNNGNNGNNDSDGRSSDGVKYHPYMADYLDDIDDVLRQQLREMNPMLKYYKEGFYVPR